MFARIYQGVYHNLLQEPRSIDPKSHFLYLRMSKEGFDVLLSNLITVTTTTVLTSAIVHTVDTQAWFTICRVAMRRGATGCARAASRRANVAAVSSQFWNALRYT